MSGSSAFYRLKPLESHAYGLLKSGEPVVLYSCTCQKYFASRACKHVLGFALKLGKIKVPAAFDTSLLPKHADINGPLGAPKTALAGQAYVRHD